MVAKGIIRGGLQTMDIKKYRAGGFKPGYEYRYFEPTRINHAFEWSDARLTPKKT